MNETNFLTKAKFSKLVESAIVKMRLTYMDAVVHVCDDYDIELEDVSKFISPIIKQKIESEAMELNFLPRVDSLF